MHKRSARVGLLLVLAAVTLGAGALMRDIDRRLDDVLSADRTIVMRLDDLRMQAATLAAAQQGYRAGTGSAGSPVEAAPRLAQEISTDAAALYSLAQSTEAVRSLQSIGETVRRVLDADARLRQALSADADETAGRFLEDASRQLKAIDDHARAARDAEVFAGDVERAALRQQAWAILAATGLIWLLGASLLVPGPPVSARSSASPDETTASAVEPPRADPAHSTPAPAIAAAGSINLTSAADACALLARGGSASAIPEVLAGTAAALQATGVSVWLATGDRLAPVAAHGYDVKVLSGLGSLARDSDNAAAEAWRNGAMRIVAADAGARGALVLPLCGPSGCIGVLAIEVPAGAETDAARQALASILAAQLCTAVTARSRVPESIGTAS